MSILLKNRDTLTELFNTFSLQDILQVNKNLDISWKLLATPPKQLLDAMKMKQVNIECFLGKKCLPLIRFYLADKQQQKSIFLSSELLGQLFVSLPAVEASIFKGQVQRAQLAVQQTNQALSSLLCSQDLTAQLNKSDAVVHLNHYQSNGKQSLSLLAEQDKEYLNCFYYQQAGELFIAKTGEVIDSDMLLYSELSPLQQLKAQQMFDKKVEQVERLNVSA